nr:unnamed protein product [Callosobruchus chinensis]
MAQIYTNGPDQIVPAETEVTVKADEYVRLRIPKSGKAIETIRPVSVPTLLRKTAKEFPNHTALAQKVNGVWKNITYAEYLQQVCTCAKGFLKLGLEYRHSVCILGFNSPEWFISDLAAIFAGGIAVGIYTTNSAEACYYCLDNSNANIVVIEDERQLEKVLEVRSRLPNLKAIVQYSGEAKHPDVITWQRLMEIGAQEPDSVLEDALKSVAINQCCTLVYTSGTVGQPKGVMLSHDNFTWDALTIIERLNLERGSEVLVSYLPLSHVAAQVVDIYITMSVGAAVYFADKDALKGSLIFTLQEAQPTKFLAVPRVWEKIYEKMQQVAAQNGYIKRTISAWAKSYALQHHLEKINGVKSNSWGYALASSVIFKKVKQALGLNRCTQFFSAAAPLAPEIKKYFLSIDIPIMECFGMSEASGAHTVCVEGASNLDTIGMTIQGMKTKIHNPDEHGQGEICMYGRHVFMGYLNEREKTNEAIDSEGWLHTGDLGRVDEKGFVYITGRLKELLITAGGENVPPVPIEQAVKSHLPHISNAFLVGDKRKFLSILLTLKTEVDVETGIPQDTLLPTVQKWLDSLGCPAKTVTEVNKAQDPKLLAALKEGVDKANKQATSNAQRIQKLALLPADFSLPTGELGPTMKVKRRVVEQKYADIIEKIYA